MEHFPITNFLGLQTGLNVPDPNSMRSGKNFVRNRRKGALQQCLGYDELFSSSYPGLPTVADNTSVHYLNPAWHKISDLTWIGIYSLYVKEHGGQDITLALGKYMKTGFHARTITNASNATPILVTTSAAHNHRTGDTVYISGVTGNTAANGYWTITKVASNTFQLDGSVGNANYISGGTVYAAQKRLGVWARPYWDGDAWVDRWRELTEMFIFEYLGYNSSRAYYQIDDGTTYNFDGIDPSGYVFNQTYFDDWVASYYNDRLTGNPTIVQYMRRTLFFGDDYTFEGYDTKYPNTGEKIFGYRNFITQNTGPGKLPYESDPFLYTIENESRLISRCGTPAEDLLLMIGFRDKVFGFVSPVPDALSVTGATNATPIVITTGVAHHRKTGDTVVISGVTGNTAANGTWVVTRLSETTFSLDGSTGNGTYSASGEIDSGPYHVDRLIIDNAEMDLFEDDINPLVNSVVTESTVPSGTIVNVSLGVDGKIFIQTSVALNVKTGTQVTISAVGGITDANGTWIVTYFSPDTFSLDNSNGSGTYTSGGLVALDSDPFEQASFFHGMTIVYDDGNESAMFEKSSITMTDALHEIDWTVNVLKAALSKRARRLRFYMSTDGDYYYRTKEIGLYANEMAWTDGYQCSTNIRITRSDFTNARSEINVMIQRSKDDKGVATFNHAIALGTKVIACNFTIAGERYPNKAIMSVANGDGGNQKDVFPYTAFTVIDLDYGDGDELRACVPIGANRLLMLKKLSMVVLIQGSNGVYQIEQSVKGIGIASIRSLQVFDDTAYWLDYNGFYSFSVNGLNLLNPTFEQTVTDFTDSVKELCISVIDRKEKKYRALLSSIGEEGLEYVFDLQDKQWFIEKRNNDAESYCVNSDGKIEFLSSSKLYIVDGSTLMNGVDFALEYQTNLFVLPAGNGMDALIESIYLEYESEIDLSLDLFLDDDVFAVNTVPYVLEAGKKRDLMLAPLGCLCKGFRFKIYGNTSGVDGTDITIKRAGVYYSVVPAMGDVVAT